MTQRKIVTIGEKADEAFLRRRTVPFDFSVHSKKAISDLIIEMRRAMLAADGIGLSANQIGYSFRVFVARVPDAQGKMKFYAVFNPEIDRADPDIESAEEGCLSVPGAFGPVERPARIHLRAVDKYGKPLKIKAWGLLARVFQHEIDHLNGILFIDKAKAVYQVSADD